MIVNYTIKIRLGDEAFWQLLIVMAVVVLAQRNFKIDQAVALCEGHRNTQLLVLFTAQADDGVRVNVSCVGTDKLIQKVNIL